MKKTHIVKGLLILLLVSTCIFGFISFKKADTAQSARSRFIDPEDMVRGRYYVLWDHGSGVFRVQFDGLNKGVIYTTISIRPTQSSFTRNEAITVYDAGDIEEASASEIAHVQRCANAGRYVP